MLKALIIEDEPVVKEFIKIVLNADYGIDPDLVDCGIKGIKFSNEKDYDFICLDNKMPGMTGVEFIKELRSTESNRNQFTPIILISAGAPEIDGIEHLLGEFFYLGKPIDTDEFEKYINDVIIPMYNAKSRI